MNPYKLKNVFEYLTSNNQLLKKKLKLGTSEIPIPPKKDSVTTIEAINRFNKANPRVDTTSLKPLSVKHSKVKQSNVDQADEGVIQGAFDTATREAQSEGFPAPSYDKFKSRYLKKNMKADGGMLVQPSDDGSRPGYAKSKIKIEAPKMTPEKQKISSTPLRDDYIGNLPKNIKSIDGKDLSKNKVYQKTLDEAIKIRNAIVLNKGYVSGVEKLGELAEIYLTGAQRPGSKQRPDVRRVRTALALAMDSFPELKNFNYSNVKYGIEGKKIKKLDMIYKTAVSSLGKGQDGLAQFLPENMGMFYERLDKNKSPKPDFFSKIYNFNKNEIKYLTDRISQDTGKTFTSNDFKSLMSNVRDYKAKVKSDKGQYKRALKMNSDIKKLYDDKVIQNLITSDTFNRKIQKDLLDRAVNIIGDDVSIASRRLFMMAQAMAGTRNIDGIELNKNLAKKIIDTERLIGKTGNGYAMSSLVYDHYGKVIDQALGSGQGKSFIGYYQQNIKNALDKGMVPDEIFSVTASARRGMAPYAIFTQALSADVNSRIKGASLDSLLSTTHRNLQEIFQGRPYNKLNTTEKKSVQDLVTIFENRKKEVLKDLKPEVKKNIQLASFDLKNPPSKSIANYDSFDKNLQKAFDKTYKEVGYSMSVTKDMQTQKQILENIQSSSKLPQCKVGAADGGRIGFAYSDECIRDGLKEKKIEAQKGNKKAAQELVQVGKVATRAGLLRNLLGPGAILGEAVYEGAVMGNKILGGTPKDIAWAESYLSYLDPRKYTPEGLDPLKMRREDMITREDFNDPDYAEGKSKTIDGPNANILRSGFAAQDQVSAFNEAINERERAKKAGRLDQYNPAAADAREQGRFVDQSKDIISSDAFQEATKQAQEYIQAQTGENMFPYNQLKQSIGKYESGEARDLRREREKEMQALGGTYQNYKNPFTKDEYENFARQEGYLDSDQQYTDEFFTNSILNPLKFEQLMNTPGFLGASEKFASGGIASLTDTIPPESGPTPHGLRYPYNNVKKI